MADLSQLDFGCSLQMGSHQTISMASPKSLNFRVKGSIPSQHSQLHKDLIADKTEQVERLAITDADVHDLELLSCNVEDRTCTENDFKAQTQTQQMGTLESFQPKATCSIEQNNDGKSKLHEGAVSPAEQGSLCKNNSQKKRLCEPKAIEAEIEAQIKSSESKKGDQGELRQIAASPISNDEARVRRSQQNGKEEFNEIAISPVLPDEEFVIPETEAVDLYSPSAAITSNHNSPDQPLHTADVQGDTLAVFDTLIVDSAQYRQAEIKNERGSDHPDNELKNLPRIAAQTMSQTVNLGKSSIPQEENLVQADLPNLTPSSKSITKSKDGNEQNGAASPKIQQADTASNDQPVVYCETQAIDFEQPMSPEEQHCLEFKATNIQSPLLQTGPHQRGMEVLDFTKNPFFVMHQGEYQTYW